MKPSLSYVVGFCTGLLIVFIVAVVAGLLWKKKYGSKERYDERQQLARGKAFKAAFAVLVIYLCLNGLISAGGGIEWSDYFTESVLGIILSVTVFAMICIFKDAYLSLKEKPVAMIILFSVVTLTNLAIGTSNLMGNTLVVDGQLTYRILSFAVSGMSLLILVSFILKLQMDKRSGDVE